jgi:uncharacterized protein
MEPRFGPVTLRERIHLLDVLRGLALFGIIAANIRAFSVPMAAYLDHSLMWQEPANRIAQGFIDVFITGKFITLFSFLFGIGFAIQMERAQARGIRGNFYLRRLAVLFLIGQAHMYLLWWGDILTVYALVGFLLFQFRRKSQRDLLWWSAGLYCWPMILIAASLAFSFAGVQASPPPPPTAAELQRVISVYSTGTYTELLRERLQESLAWWGLVPLVSLHYLGIFLFGMWFWRTGIVRNIPAHIPTLKRCCWWGLGLGVSLNLAAVAIQEMWHPEAFAMTAPGLFRDLISYAAVPALSLFYASGLALIYEREEWRRRLKPFCAIGRTALTNYLLQTAIATLLFYSYGLGLYGQVGPLVGFGIAILIYIAQVAASLWWTRRFAFGPVEWVWRTLTYAHLSRPAAAADT